MSMKKTILISALAAALSTSAVGVASAATKQQATATIPYNVMINDTTVQIRSVEMDGMKLISLRDLGDAIGVAFVANVKAGVTGYLQTHSVELHAGSNVALVDNEQVDLQEAIKNVNGAYYISLEDFTNIFEIDNIVDNAGLVWLDTVQKIHADSISWINANQLLASQLSENGRTDYIVDAKTGAYKQLMSSVVASDLKISPDGKKAAYTNEDGSLYVIDLASKHFPTMTISTDNTIKPELVWSADGSAIYFLQGDKGTVIQKMNLADGKLTKVLDDKMDYKANLSVSEDGTKFYYTVTKPGAVTADANKPVDQDDVAIDTTGTEPQVYFFDASVKDAAAVKLTTSTDDKVFVGAAADGSKAYYVSVEDNKPSSLVAIAKDKTITKLIGDKDVLQATLAGGKIYALTDAGNKTALYEVDATTGANKLLSSFEGNASQVVAGSNTPIAVVVDDQTFVIQNNGLKKVTK